MYVGVWMKRDELCKEPEELKYEGEGILSGCPKNKKHGERKTEKGSKREY